MTKNILKFTATGVVAGLVMGWMLSLVSGNIFVVWGVGTLGLVVGGVAERAVWFKTEHQQMDQFAGDIDPVRYLT